MIKANINKEIKNGQTPFCIACYSGHIEIVELLLNDQRVDVNKGKNTFGMTLVYCWKKISQIFNNLL